MSANLIESLGGLVTPNALQAAAKLTGEPTGALGKAFGAAFPTILGGILSNASNASVLGQITNILMQGAGSTGWLGNLAGSLAAGMVPASAMSLGSMLLSLLFGKKLDSLGPLIGSLSGLKPSAASSVLGLAAPMIMGLLADRLKSAGGISPANLHSFLTQQSGSIQAAIPSQIASLLSAPVAATAATAAAAAAAAHTAASMPAPMPAAAAPMTVAAAPMTAAAAPAAAAPVAAAAPAAAPPRPASTPAPAAPAAPSRPAMAAAAPAAPAMSMHTHTSTESATGSRLGLLAGWWLLLGLITALIWLWWSQHTIAPIKLSETPRSVAPVVKAEPPKPASAAAPAPVASPEKQAAAQPSSAPAAAGPVAVLAPPPVPVAAALDFVPSPAEMKLIAFINDGSKQVDKTTWFDFPNITFKTASAEITDDAIVEVKHIFAILKAFPATAIKIGGYTDNTGDADRNLALSGERAKAVMAALTGMGIAADRLESEGYGSAHEVASNDTEEGRAQNRRISLRVTQK